MGLEIKLDENYCLTSDKNGYQLSTRAVQKDGSVKFAGQKFAGTIDRVLEAWVQQRARDIDATTFGELKEALNGIYEELNAIRKALEVRKAA